ncbi:MAG: hypothetical protein OR994_07415, partial [Candidatus Poseidoniales archaeon]|nr:hypothetical protein [Candidatus Poseidoniales archaeon]
FLLQLSGDTVPFNFQGYALTLGNLSVQWIDDIAPQLSSVDHRISGNIGRPIRVGDTFAVTLGDGVGETTLSGSAWIHQGDSTKPAITYPLAYFSALGRYYTTFDSSQFDPATTTQHYIALQLIDEHGNVLLVEQAYAFEIGPVIPSVTSIAMRAANNSHSAVSESEDSSSWELDDDGFIFSVTSLYNRSDLSASVTLSPSDGNSQLIMLNWDQNESAYTGHWSADQGDLKTWQLEVDIAETTGQMAEDSDGYQNGVDYSFSLVDVTGPVLTVIDHDEIILIGDEVLVQLQWLSDPSELINGYAIVTINGSSVANQTISPVNTGMSSLLLQTTDWDIGFYQLTVFLFDENGNPNQMDINSSMFEIIPLSPLVSGDINGWEFDSNNLNLTISGQHQFRFTQGLVTISSAGTTLLDNQSIQDGAWSFEVSLSSILEEMIEVQVRVCDATDSNDCEQYSNSINASTSIQFNVEIQCTEVTQSLQMNTSETLVSCIINNSNGTYPMQVVLTALQASSFIQDSTSEGELPAQGQLELSLLIDTGLEEGTWSQPWVLSITDRIGQVSVLNQSSTSFTVIPAQQQDENITQITTEGEGESSSGMTAIIIAILAVIAIIATLGFLKLRKEDEIQDDTKRFTSEFDQVHQPVEQEIVEQQPIEQPHPEQPLPTQQPVEQEIVEQQPIEQPHPQQPVVQQSQPFTPAIDAIPTSTDESGYEWFTEQNGTNWYRLQASGSVWYLHQP